jgi:hypothetical protein
MRTKKLGNISLVVRPHGSSFPSPLAPEAHWSLSLPGFVNPPWRGLVAPPRDLGFVKQENKKG